MTTVGTNIKQRREELGLTQEELAKKMGYKSKSTINKIEAGINDITQSKVVAFSKALETTPAALMGWEEIKTGPDDSHMVIEHTIPHSKVIIQGKKNDQQQIKRLVSYYMRLNELGKKKALDNLEDLAKIYSEKESAPYDNLSIDGLVVAEKPSPYGSVSKTLDKEK